MLGLQVGDMGDINLRTGKVKIQQIRLTNGEIEHCTKTLKTRIHNLNSLSKSAIETLLGLPLVKIFRKQLKVLLKLLGILERRM